MRDVYGEAFVRSVAHKFAVEVGAAVSDSPVLTAVTYPEPLEHPWPRSFAYTTELFAGSASPGEVVARAQEVVGDRDHVLNVMAEPDGLEGFVSRGYTHAWTNVIMVAPVAGDNFAWPDGVTVITDASEVASVNAIEPDNPCHEAAVADPHLTDLVAWSGDRVAAKAQLVTLPDAPAYLSDMFTAPWARRQGLGTLLLDCAGEVASRSGCGEMILVPSRQTREDRFYANRGFVDVVPMSLLIPAIQ